MPELPDAVVYRQRIERRALGRPIARFIVEDAILVRDGTEPADLETRLPGESLTRTHRHGKHVFARVGNGGWLALHFGMTGRVQVSDVADGEIPDYAYVRLHFDGSGGRGGWMALVCPRKFARIAWTPSPDAFLREKNLGPDARRVDEDGFRALLKGHRGTLKGAFLDQRLIAGLGNIYADEILYQTRLHPRTPVASLDDSAIRHLYTAMHDVLDAAIDAGADPTALDPDRFMLPHRYGDKRCPDTGEALETESVAGRTAYFAPARQLRDGPDS